MISDKNLNSYAIGDCGDVQDHSLPCTAQVSFIYLCVRRKFLTFQVAERQGRYIATCLNEIAKVGSPSKPFTFKSMGMLAYIGGYKALSDLPEFKLKGITSWLLW